MTVEVTFVFRDVLEARPFEAANAVERDARYRHILVVICDELRATGTDAVLISPKRRLDLPVSDLERNSPVVLGDVGTIHFKPSWLTYLDLNSRVFIPEEVGRASVSRAIREVDSGQWLTIGDTPPPEADGEVQLADTKKTRHKTIAAAYWKRYPNGHEIIGVTWLEVPHQLDLERVPSLCTVKRALGRKK